MSRNTTFDLRSAAESQLDAIAHIASHRSICSTPEKIEKTRRLLTNLTFALQVTINNWEQAEAEIAELKRQAAAAEAAAEHDTSADLHEQIC